MFAPDDLLLALKEAGVEFVMQLLVEVDARQVGLGDFDANEFPYDPTDPSELAQGGNFRLETRLGPIEAASTTSSQ